MAARSVAFTLEQLDNPRLEPTGVLAALVSRTVPRCSIEFLRTNDIKPHVVFNLKANPPAGQAVQPTMKGCRLSMEWEGDNGDEGTFTITALPYIESSNKATAAFDFNVNAQITIRNWIEIFRGVYPRLQPAQRTNLTDFDFVATPADKMDGCRDFICQCFLRVYMLSIVQGYSNGLSGISENTQIIGFNQHIHPHPELGDPNLVWFFDIIDKNFRKGRSGNRDTITVIPEPMHRGEFQDPRFVRIETFPAGNPVHQYPLNYVRRPAAPNPPGNNPGPGGPPGGAGGAGGAGRGGGNTPQGRPGQSGVPPSNGSGSGTGAGRGGQPPAGGPPGNQLGKGPAARPSQMNPGMGLAPVKKIGATGPAALASRPKIPTTTAPPPSRTTATRPPPAQTATRPPPAQTATRPPPAQTKVTPTVKGTPTKTTPVTKGTPVKGTPVKKTKP